MLKSLIAMSSFKAPSHLLILWAFALALLLPALPVGRAAAFQSTPEPEIGVISPGGGEALQGVVSIRGTTQVEGFRSVEVSFAYQADTTGTWFLIDQSDRAVVDGDLASWDTTTITDGTYRLRLQVFREGEQPLEQIVEGLRVRNYSPVETSTPTRQPAPQSGGADITPTPGPTLPPPTSTPAAYQPAARTPVPLPTNPAQLTVQDLRTSAAQGIAVVLGAALAAGVYLGARSVFRR